MGFLNDLPNLTTSLLTKLWGAVCKLFFLLPGTLIHGTMLVHVDERLRVDIKRPYRREYPEPGLYVNADGGVWIPLDESATHAYTMYGVDVYLAFGDIRAFLRPSALETDEADVDLALEDRLLDDQGRLIGGWSVTDGGAVQTTANAIARTMAQFGPSRSIRHTLAMPFLMGYFMLAGAFCIHLDDNGRMDWVKAQVVNEPAYGLVVDDEFKKAEAPGVLFERWGGTMAVSAKGWESLFNLATAEILRSKDEYERDTGTSVGAGETEVTVVRRTVAFAHDRLADYAPFDMFDGAQTRRQVQTGYEAHRKKESSSDLLMYGGMIIAFFVGALSPRISGTGGGGGGGGGGISLPMPTLVPSPDLLVHASDVAGHMTALGVV